VSAKDTMKKPSTLGLILLTACSAVGAAACSDSNSSASNTGGAANSMSGSGGLVATGGVANTGGVTSTGGVAGSSNPAGGPGGGVGATGGDVSAAGAAAAGAGGMCDLPPLQVFPRSDTEQEWDDNDFSEVNYSGDGTCPALLDVTWPHEMGWENADPAESNHEPTRFTLDSGHTADLTGKQLNVTIELTKDMRGPAATAGGYVVSLVSVSSFTRVVAGGAGGGGGGGGSGGVAGGGAGGVVDPCSNAEPGGSGGVPTAGAGGAVTAGGASAGGMNGGAAAGGKGGGGRAGAGGDSAGAAGTSNAGAPAAAGSAAGGAGGTAGVSGTTAGSGGADAGGVAGMEGAGGAAPATETGYAEAVSPREDRRTLYRVGDRATLSFVLPNKTAKEDSYDPARPIKINVRVETLFTGCVMPAPVYDYLTSQFAITSFTVTDAPAPAP
jgi:hypothetical protein